MNLIKRIEELTPEFIAIRRDFHRYPEIGHQENVTAEKIANYLRQWGYQVHTKIAGTGVVALLKCGDSSKCLSIRADMDALPIEEANCFAHASVNKGVMHACGHDGHASIGLTTARILMELSEHLHGTLKIIFQPAEEGVRGAKSICESGFLDDVDYIYAAHIMPRAGDYDLYFGMNESFATTKLDVIYHGVSTHAAESPQFGKNALLSAANFTLNFTAAFVILQMKGVDLMPNIKPISDLRNYNEVLRDVEAGSPVFLTKNGRGKYAILDMEDYEKTQATIRLMNEIAKGRCSGETEKLYTPEEMRAHFRARANGK